MFSKRTAGGWVDYDMGSHRTPLMLKRGHFLQDKLDLDCKISKMCLKLEM